MDLVTRLFTLGTTAWSVDGVYVVGLALVLTLFEADHCLRHLIAFPDQDLSLSSE